MRPKAMSRTMKVAILKQKRRMPMAQTMKGGTFQASSALRGT